MEIKVKYPHLLKFIIALLQSAWVLSIHYFLDFNFLNVLGYLTVLAILEIIKGRITKL